jgi:YHS domain-containing protein
MRHSTRRKPVTILLLMFGAVAAPLVLARASQPAVNEWCPVMTEEKADPTITTVHRGKTVAFCCDTCLKKFLANPAKYEGRLPQFATPMSTTPRARMYTARNRVTGKRARQLSPMHTDTITIMPQLLRATNVNRCSAVCTRQSYTSRWRDCRWPCWASLFGQ